MAESTKESTPLLKNIEQNRNLIISLNQTIASMGLEKVGQGGLANMVTPATWIADHAVNGNSPGFIDGAIWVVGVMGASAASTTVSIWKAIVDDATQQQYVEALAEEPAEYARYFLLCAKTSSVAPTIAAQSFAAKGGTAWQNKNGVWICAQDARGKPIYNYSPKSFAVLYQPSVPLTKGPNGRYKITLKRGQDR